MEKFGKSQSVTRIEDLRFLTGTGRYVDDITPQGALVGYVVRASEAHAAIASLNVDAARALEGVHLVLTAQDLLDAGIDINMSGPGVKQIDGTKGAAPLRPILAVDTVRHVGEAVVFVVADTLQIAMDAGELVDLEYASKPVHLGLTTGGDAIHPEAPENLAFDYGRGDKQAVDDALAAAAHVVRVQIPDNRIIANSLEPRGCYAEMEGKRLHVCVNGQGVWGTKDRIVDRLGIDPDDLRVTNPDVGGAFGMKAFAYPETMLTAHATRVLGLPVKWMSARTEAMLSDNAGRDLTSTATLGFDADHRLVAYRLDTLANMGAYNSGFAQFIQTDLFSMVLPGTYDLQNIWMNTKGVYTNTTPVDAYRGAGRPEAIFAIERAMDFAAREMGVDPWELRRINFIRPDQFPYTSATGVTYDVGEFERLLDRAAQEADRDAFAARRVVSQASGKLRGLGLSYYIESILGDPSETTTVVFEGDGAEIHVGTQSGGQGHETVFATFLSDHTGIPFDKITFVQGDSDRIKKGGGTGGSRSVTVQNTATLATVEQIVTAFSAFLGDEFGVDATQVGFDNESFRIPGSNLAPTMLDVADMARAKGRDDLLKHSAKIQLENRSFPNGAHVAEIEIDPDTGVIDILRYTVVDDFGNLINPMLAEGQVHGGVAQGLGQALTEHCVFDTNGQLLTATFMDYAMPRADTMPCVAFHSVPVPSKYNPMGMKGCGEAGTVGALAAITNAVQDAVWDRGLRNMEMPFTPNRVWTMLQEA